MKEKNSFFGWWIIFYGVMLMCTCFALVKSCHGLFLLPVIETLGVDRTSFSLVFTICGLSVGFASPLMGRLLSQYNFKLVMLISITMVTFGFAGYSFATELWHFYLIAFITGIGIAGGTNISISIMINNWFIDKRGLALGLAFAGSGIGAAVLSPLITHSLNTKGWEFTYLFFGLFAAAVCIPLTWFLAYRHPKDKGQAPYVQQKQDLTATGVRGFQGISLQQAQRMTTFWGYLLFMLVLSTVIGGVHLHIPAYLIDIGHTESFSALIYSVLSIFLIVGKVSLGTIFDRLGGIKGTMVVGLCYVLALVALLYAERAWVSFGFAILYGFGASFTTVGITYLTATLFGGKDYANILGRVNMSYVFGAALGPLLSGILFDVTGSYDFAWKLYLGMFILSITGLIVLLGKVKQQLSTTI